MFHSILIILNDNSIKDNFVKQEKIEKILSLFLEKINFQFYFKVKEVYLVAVTV